MRRISFDTGDLNDLYPMNHAHCQEMLNNIYYLMARGTIPSDYINNSFESTQVRIRAKRLRERMINFGYQLIILLDEVTVHDISVKDVMWREALLSVSTQFFLSIEQLHDYIEENKENTHEHTRCVGNNESH